VRLPLVLAQAWGLVPGLGPQVLGRPPPGAVRWSQPVSQPGVEPGAARPRLVWGLLE